MIERYTRAEMGDIWTAKARFAYMLEVEKAVAEAQGKLKIIPRESAEIILKKASFSLGEISELEKTTKHDVIAFVSSVAKSVGEHGRYVHFGLTSSDVLDTATNVQIKEAGEILLKSLERLEQALRKKIKKHKSTLCAGRTHGMHAEPTTFGFKLAGHLMELKRNQERMLRALRQMQIAKLSGAVGTYSTQSEQVEAKVAKKFGFKVETVATQVIPRDRYAELFFSLALLATGIERLAVELRHLQRTEVGEVCEGFTPGQKGSSAMPHKKNPIGSENLSGLARLLRGYAQSALENVPLWHERDISHSSVERVILPDSFIVVDYALDRMAKIIEEIYVDEERMMTNMSLSRGGLFSSHVLLLLVESGLDRDQAYQIIQEASHQLKAGEGLKEALIRHPIVAERISSKELEKIFSGKTHKEAVVAALKRALPEMKI